jgi:hypothetical protein
MKEKDLFFLPTSKERKRKADPHLAHSLLHRHMSQCFAQVKEPFLTSHEKSKFINTNFKFNTYGNN